MNNNLLSQNNIDSISTIKKDSIIYNLENSLTIVYMKNNNINTYSSSFNGNNTITYKNSNINFNTNYSTTFSNILSSNEFLNKINISHYNIFTSYIFNYSLSRNIKSDNSFGIGYGIKYKYKFISGGLSYALMYENTNYNNLPTTEIFRHSIRCKLKIERKLLNISNEYYYQPNIKNSKDYLIYGNTKIILLPKNKFNFTIQDVLNFRSISTVKTIHNITFGINYNFQKIEIVNRGKI